MKLKGKLMILLWSFIFIWRVCYEFTNPTKTTTLACTNLVYKKLNYFTQSIHYQTIYNMASISEIQKSWGRFLSLAPPNRQPEMPPPSSEQQTILHWDDQTTHILMFLDLSFWNSMLLLGSSYHSTLSSYMFCEREIMSLMMFCTV